jgi:hypothetical protein
MKQGLEKEKKEEEKIKKTLEPAKKVNYGKIYLQ